MASSQLSPKSRVRARRARLFALFAPVALVWLALDQATKAFFNGGQFQLGEAITGPIAGIFRFRLVHNTGGAWSMFEGSTAALGVFSVVVVIAIVAVLWKFAPHVSGAMALGLSLVAAGGAGNAIDRFALGYVVDFIEPVFIQFPVFNVADIGVTCGFVVFLVAVVAAERRAAALERDAR